MDEVAFLKFEFGALVACSLVFPTWICWFLVRRRSISRSSVLGFSILLILLASADAILLQRLGSAAKVTGTLADDAIFASEFSVALYALPLLAAGLGVNLLSHLVTSHLTYAEMEHDREVLMHSARQLTRPPADDSRAPGERPEGH